jgi:hypothetical protein
MRRRKNYRGFGFTTRSKRRTLGRLGRVDDYGPTQTATLYVGQDKGGERPNREGVCQRAPERVTVRDMDRTFLRHRVKQVGREATGATRITGKGWYKGKPEDATKYEVIYIPNDREGSYAKFRKNMNKLAEKMGKKLCQDSVIVVHNDGNKAQSCGAVWYDRRKGSCK